jgi:hypothetical protein
VCCAPTRRSLAIEGAQATGVVELELVQGRYFELPL